MSIFGWILFGLAVSSGVDRLERFRIPRGVGAGLIVLTFIGALVAFGATVAPTLREQGGELQKKIPEAIDRVEKWMNEKQAGPLGMVMNGIGTKPDSAAPAAGQPGTVTGAVPPAAQVPANPSTGMASSGTKPPESFRSCIRRSRHSPDCCSSSSWRSTSPPTRDSIIAG